jgi:hypothetical protein
MNKFEQLIEYVINDDEAKARELFHDIVVEKSRAIYEEMMEDEEELEENDDMMGGDEADSLIDDIETEESGISMEDDEMGMDVEMDDGMGGDGFADEEFGGDEEDAGLEDRVVDLEDKLDELMAEFESLMGDEAGEGHGDEEMDMDMDMEVGDGMDDEEVVDDELETEGMFEAVTLKAVPKPTHGDNGQNAKSPVAANSGAKGMAAKPNRLGDGDGGNGRPAPGTKELIGKVGNSPAQSTQKPTPAPKPHLAQATGVNTKSVTN